MMEFDTVIALHLKGLSNREIGRTLNIHRERVRRILQMAGMKSRFTKPPAETRVFGPREGGYRAGDPFMEWVGGGGVVPVRLLAVVSEVHEHFLRCKVYAKRKEGQEFLYYECYKRHATIDNYGS